MPEKTARRDFVLAGLYGIAGAIGGMAGRAMASAADEPSWQYGVSWQRPGSPNAGFYGPTDRLRDAAREYLARKAAGCTARVERRAVGPWERYEPAEHVAAELASRVD